MAQLTSNQEFILNRIREKIYSAHKEVNQYYDRGNLNLPYSFHLHVVEKQVDRFAYLLDENPFENWDYFLAKAGAICHDTIEDIHFYTYNSLVDDLIDCFAGTIYIAESKDLAKAIADIAFGCSESAGKTRSERHDDEYYARVNSHYLNTYVKLCDIFGNSLFGLLMGGNSMFKKYSKEFNHTKEMLYDHYERFKDLFDEIEKIYVIK